MLQWERQGPAPTCLRPAATISQPPLLILHIHASTQLFLRVAHTASLRVAHTAGTLLLPAPSLSSFDFLQFCINTLDVVMQKVAEGDMQLLWALGDTDPTAPRRLLGLATTLQGRVEADFHPANPLQPAVLIGLAKTLTGLVGELNTLTHRAALEAVAARACVVLERIVGDWKLACEHGRPVVEMQDSVKVAALGCTSNLIGESLLREKDAAQEAKYKKLRADCRTAGFVALKAHTGLLHLLEGAELGRQAGIHWVGMGA